MMTPASLDDFLLRADFLLRTDEVPGLRPASTPRSHLGGVAADNDLGSRVQGSSRSTHDG